MSRLPSLRPKAVAAALQRAGFVRQRQSGSHLHLSHPDGRECVIPMHNKDLKRATLMSILKQAGFTAESFQEWL